MARFPAAVGKARPLGKRLGFRLPPTLGVAANAGAILNLRLLWRIPKPDDHTAENEGIGMGEIAGSAEAMGGKNGDVEARLMKSRVNSPIARMRPSRSRSPGI